jgi:hypothetical protein
MPPKRKSTTKSADQPAKKPRASRTRAKKPANGVHSQYVHLPETNNVLLSKPMIPSKAHLLTLSQLCFQ